MKKKHFFGPDPHLSKIELLPVVLGCSSCSKHCSEISIEPYYCKTKEKCYFGLANPSFTKIELLPVVPGCSTCSESCSEFF